MECRLQQRRRVRPPATARRSSRRSSTSENAKWVVIGKNDVARRVVARHPERWEAVGTATIIDGTTAVPAQAVARFRNRRRRPASDSEVYPRGTTQRRCRASRAPHASGRRPLTAAPHPRTVSPTGFNLFAFARRDRARYIERRIRRALHREPPDRRHVAEHAQQLELTRQRAYRRTWPSAWRRRRAPPLRACRTRPARSRALFSPMPFAPGNPSEGSLRSAMKSGTWSGRIPYRTFTSAASTRAGGAPPFCNMSTVMRSFTDWYMSRSPVTTSAVPPRLRLDLARTSE